MIQVGVVVRRPEYLSNILPNDVCRTSTERESVNNNIDAGMICYFNCTYQAIFHFILHRSSCLPIALSIRHAVVLTKTNHIERIDHDVSI